MMRLFHKFKCSKLPMNWENYRKAQNEYKNGLHTAQNDYKKSLTEHHHPMKILSPGGLLLNGYLVTGETNHIQHLM